MAAFSGVTNRFGRYADTGVSILDIIRQRQLENARGFTLVELMVVILIIGVLAAVAIPILRGHTDSVKWSEGKATMGSIATALRAYIVESGASFSRRPTASQLGFSSGDLEGAYFTSRSYWWVIIDDDPIRYLIIARAPRGIRSPVLVILDQSGQFSELGRSMASP